MMLFGELITSEFSMHGGPFLVNSICMGAHIALSVYILRV